jgi:hypothetical protein
MRSRIYRNLYFRHSENCNEIYPKDMQTRGRTYPETVKNIFIRIKHILIEE